MPDRKQGCEIQVLERRTLLAVTPASPRADSLGQAFDAGERQFLLDRMTHLSASTRSNLQTKLRNGVGGFDSTLLAYMRTRGGPSFFFDPAETNDIGQFIVNNNISFTELQSRVDSVVDSH